MFRPALPGALALALLLASCASQGMDKAQCRTADWHAIGFEDGNQGRSAAALGRHRTDCAGHGVTPVFAAWQDGYAQGITGYCRPQNGYRLGVAGKRYGGVCPTGLETAFLAAHADGYGLYARRAAITRLDKQIHRKQNRANRIELQMAEKTAALVLPQTLPAQRLTLGVELKQLTGERVAIEHEIAALEADLAHARQDYQDYSENLARR